MIIIESQSRNSILKCDIINVNGYNQIIANYKVIIDGEGCRTEEYDLLGTYETEERAIQVMEEIKALIEFVSNTKTFGESQLHVCIQLLAEKCPKLPLTTIYTMPKE